MISPRLQTSTFTPLNTSNVFTSTLNEDGQNTSFSSYHVTPRQCVTPQQLSRIQENNEVENSQITETDPQTYREVIKELSTQLQMAILENRQLKDKLNVLEEEHNEGFQLINTQNSQLQESNFTLQEKINNLFSEIQQMQHQLEQKDQRLKEIREINNNEDRMNHLIEENQKLIKIIGTQQQEIKIQKDVIKQFEQALADAKANEGELSNKQLTKVKEYEQLKLDVEAYKHQQQQYQEQLMLWSQRYKSLDQNYQIQYQDLFQKFNISQNQLTELHQVLECEQDNNQRKIQQMMRELENSKQGTYKKQQNHKLKQLEDTIEELEDQLRNKKNLIVQLKEELLEFQNVQKITRQRDSEGFQDKKNIDEQMSEKYEQRIRLLEDQILKQQQQQVLSQQNQQQALQLQYQSQPTQQQQQQQPQQQQQMYERSCYHRQNENVKMQLFSEKKDNYRPYYSFAKENHPAENKYPRTALTFGNNY